MAYFLQALPTILSSITIAIIFWLYRSYKKLDTLDKDLYTAMDLVKREHSDFKAEIKKELRVISTLLQENEQIFRGQLKQNEEVHKVILQCVHVIMLNIAHGVKDVHFDNAYKELNKTTY